MDYDYDKYYDLVDEMQDTIDAAIAASGREEKPLIYSAYDDDENEMPINNLNEVAFKGTFTVIYAHSNFWDGRGIGLLGVPAEEQGGGEPCGRPYRSEEVTDPTWLTLAVLANEAILTTNDLHHVFLESVTQDGDELELHFGS